MDGLPIVQLPLWGQAISAAAYILGGNPCRYTIAVVLADGARSALAPRDLHLAPHGVRGRAKRPRTLEHVMGVDPAHLLLCRLVALCFHE